MMEKEQYDLLYECEEHMWWFAGMRRIAETLLGSRIRPGLSCLEAGCGTGFNSLYFAGHYDWKVFPFDLSGDALHFTQQRGVERLAQASLAELPYRDESFDCATCLDVVSLLPFDLGTAAARELYRVLKPGGFLLLRTAAHEWMRGQHSARTREQHRYNVPELVRLLTSVGFTVERATYANFFLLPLALFKRKVLEPLRLASLEGDVRPTNPLLDRLFLTALHAENSMLQRRPALPTGVSAIVVAVR